MIAIHSGHLLVLVFWLLCFTSWQVEHADSSASTAPYQCDGYFLKHLDVCHYLFSDSELEKKLLKNDDFNCHRLRDDDDDVKDPYVAAFGGPQALSSKQVCRRLQGYLSPHITLTRGRKDPLGHMLELLKSDPKTNPRRVHPRFLCFQQMGYYVRFEQLKFYQKPCLPFIPESWDHILVSAEKSAAAAAAAVASSSSVLSPTSKDEFSPVSSPSLSRSSSLLSPTSKDEAPFSPSLSRASSIDSSSNSLSPSSSPLSILRSFSFTPSSLSSKPSTSSSSSTESNPEPSSDLPSPQEKKLPWKIRPICLYLHGSGEHVVNSGTVENSSQDILPRLYLQQFYGYWDNVPDKILEESSQIGPNYHLCEPIFFQSHTLEIAWSSKALQEHYCGAIKALKPVVVFTHSMANVIIAAGVARQVPGCNMIRNVRAPPGVAQTGTVYWQSIQGLFKGSQALIRVAEECTSPSGLILKIASKSMGYCAKDQSPYHTNFWGLMPAYASMHPQHANPAIGYDVNKPVPEFYCNPEENIVPHALASYDGKLLEISYSNLYLSNKVTPTSVLFLKIQYGMTTGNFIRTILKGLPVITNEAGHLTTEPGYIRTAFPWKHLYELSKQDATRFRKMLKYGIIIQLSVCLFVHTISRTDAGMKKALDLLGNGNNLVDCDPVQPSSRIFAKMKFEWPKSVSSYLPFSGDTYDISNLKFGNQPEPRTLKRPAKCVTLLNVASEYIDGQLCGITHSAPYNANAESHELAALGWVLDHSSPSYYTSSIWAKDRYNQPINVNKAILQREDGMVNYDTCAIRLYGSNELEKYSDDDPTSRLYSPKSNHAEGQCYHTDSGSPDMQPCQWQTERVKERITKTAVVDVIQRSESEHSMDHLIVNPKKPIIRQRYFRNDDIYAMCVTVIGELLKKIDNDHLTRRESPKDIQERKSDLLKKHKVALLELKRDILSRLRVVTETRPKQRPIDFSGVLTEQQWRNNIANPAWFKEILFLLDEYVNQFTLELSKMNNSLDNEYAKQQIMNQIQTYPTKQFIEKAQLNKIKLTNKEIISIYGNYHVTRDVTELSSTLIECMSGVAEGCSF